MTLRIALTVLPVGPRGRDTIGNDPLCFAVQVSAGFEQQPDSTDVVDKLWPWVLHVVKNDAVALRGWIIDANGGTDDFPLSAAVVLDDFAESLRKQIADMYDDADVRDSLDLRLLFPADAPDEQYERDSFPARLQYLATLPGEMARRLLATLYVFIPIGKLFERDTNNEWVPKRQTLWIAPEAVNAPNAEVALTGPPAGAMPAIIGNDGVMPVVATGPGFALSRFLDPAPSPVFDLTTYTLPVSVGDERFVELEKVLLDVLDPFGEADFLRASALRAQLSLTTGGLTRPVTEDAFAALADLWRVRAFAGELTHIFATPAAAGVQQLASMFLPPDTPPPALTIPPRWGIDFTTELQQPDLLLLARSLASRLGNAEQDARTTLRRVSERSGYAAAARWLVQAFDETLQASANVPEALTGAWSFGGATGSVLSERRTSVALAAVTQRREERLVPPILEALSGASLPGNAADHVRATMQAKLDAPAVWAARFDQPVLSALSALAFLSGEQFVVEAGAPAFFPAAFIDAVWPAAKVLRPELPGRGLALVVGDRKQRLVHEKNADADDATSVYREVAGVLLLGRRGTDDTDLEQRPWRILTAGAALAGPLGERLFVPHQLEDEEWLRELLPLPLRPVFQQKVARADVEYHGQPMLAQSALDHAYPAETDTTSGLDPSYTFHSLGSFTAGLQPERIASGAPALRYGDVYEFRAAVIDQAGGLPSGLSRTGEPWRLDPAKVILATAVQNEVADYRRAVPVGDVNIIPPEIAAEPRRAWPKLPDDVVLRSREWWALSHDRVDSLPALLVSERGRFTGTLAAQEFQLLPPAIDEHTLIRWAFPAIGDANHQAALDALEEALTAVLEARAADNSTFQLHDPAVTRLGFRLTTAGDDNIVTPPVSSLIEPPPGAGAHTRLAIPVRVTAAPFGGAASMTAAPAAVNITVPEGSFAVLEVFPLVLRTDFDARFATLVEFDDLLDPNAGFADFVAFRPAVVLLEGATDALPKAVDLFQALQLDDQHGDVAVRFESKDPVPHLVFGERFTVERERWVWRNLPLTTPEIVAAAETDAERRRLAASGPPADAFDEKKRDQSLAVADWERLAGLDRGFVNRGDVTGRWPRVTPAEGNAGGPARNVLLTLDNRDAVTAADYLRYGLRIRSRYAGVLPAAARERRAVESDAKDAQVRRRIVVGFRGTELKPPKILAVVPLTASLERDPVGTPSGAAPFLVLLNETFFREYGVGERLQAHLALENLDFHETVATKLPYRTGALPDHWLRSRPADDKPPYFRGLEVTHATDDLEPIALDLFGPFGYSLDITPSEALANASAFVAYPPPDVKAHWAMFTRLRRVLDLPSTQFPPTNEKPERPKFVSDWSDTHALYTLPDVRLLASPRGAAPAIELNGGTASLRDLRLLLDPLTQPAPDTANAAKNSEAASQYRYFMLVSRVLAGAGQGFDAELPVGLWRLSPTGSGTGYQPPGTFTVELRPDATLPAAQLTGSAALETTSTYRGRILEVLLNGRYDAAARLDGVTVFRAFWEALLNDDGESAGQDAAGMIRRVSESFAVRKPPV